MQLTDNYKKFNAQVVQLDTVVLFPSKMAFPQVFVHTNDINQHICTVENLWVCTFVGQKYLCQPERWYSPGLQCVATIWVPDSWNKLLITIMACVYIGGYKAWGGVYKWRADLGQSLHCICSQELFCNK